MSYSAFLGQAQLPCEQDYQQSNQHIHRSAIQAEDIMLGKDFHCRSHVGSIALKVLIQTRIHIYVSDDASSVLRKHKTKLTKEVVAMIHNAGGRFLVQTPNFQHKEKDLYWRVLGQNEARVKVRDHFRDYIKNIQNQRSPSVLLQKIGVSNLFNQRATYDVILNYIAHCPQVRAYVAMQLLDKATKKKGRDGADLAEPSEAAVNVTIIYCKG